MYACFSEQYTCIDVHTVKKLAANPAWSANTNAEVHFSSELPCAALQAAAITQKHVVVVTGLKK